MLVNNIHLAELNSPKQTIRARVEILKGEDLERICTCADILSEFSIERAGESKYFGYGICQKLIAKFIDLDEDLHITSENNLQVAFGVNDDFIYLYPAFHVEEAPRDEGTSEVTVTAYDALYKAAEYRVSDLNLIAPYTVRDVAVACARILNMPIAYVGVPSTDAAFDTAYPSGANFDGTETVREALNAIAEVTQTIYYMNSDWALTFKRISNNDDAALTIGKNEYFEFINGDVRVLSNICHTTELGDNVTTTSEIEGVTQYVRENPFWELRDDIDTLLENAKANAVGLSINQFESTWKGNYLLEIGDKIEIEKNKGGYITTYILDDTITFSGTLLETSRWSFENNEAETAANPTSLGDSLKQTYARVDKANKRIDLVVNDVNIMQSTTEEELQTIKENQTTFTQTAESISLRVESIETTGATKVNTGTGFTFDEEGLRINKDNSGIENLIDNTGMYVKQDGTEVLSVNEVGVKAKDLHAVTYLWIGSHSRFEDYESGRTGCFWIGR